MVVNALRIAHVTATFPPYQAGTGIVCYHNARELARRGHVVHVYTASYGDAPAQEDLDGFTIHRLPALFCFGNAPFLPRLLKIKDFDIIHLHFPFFGGEIAALTARVNRTPLVITYHQDVLLSGALGLVAKLLHSTIGRWTLRSAEKVLFTSTDYGQASYIRPMLRGRERHIGELPNGVDTNRFSLGEPPLELVNRYKPQPDDRLVLLVAALDQAHYFKGVSIFLEALTRLPNTTKGMIVGEGDLKSTYQTKVETLGLVNRISFPGRVKDEDLPLYYQLADVTILPSVTMGEAFGLVLIESLACGTPVVASNLPGVRTVVYDGEDGFLVQPGDTDDLVEKVERLLGLPEFQRLAMGQTGRNKVVERYAWEHVGDQLESIYKAVMDDSAHDSQAHSQI